MSVTLPTIKDAIEDYLNTVKLARSEKTLLAYATAMKNFTITLQDHQLNVEQDPVSNITEDVISWFATDLKDYAATSEQLYITSLKGFLEYLVAEELADINLSKVKLLIRQRTRKPGKRLPQFPANAIQKILDHLENMQIQRSEDENDYLRALRDKAFLITLADTGLRVHEACGLRRGDLDWNEGKAMVIGKGDRQAVVRFSRRSQKAIKDYIQARSIFDGKSHKPLGALPLFARHDKGAGEKIKPITPTTGRNIVAEWVEAILGPEAVGTITPHSFRHFFVTRVLTSTGNLKLAQNLARHKNIAVTQRYAHLTDDELDRGYWEVFEDSQGG
ncbi:MAG: tyrosine-type recombinase/integrase [Anaerolineae bacterium]|nr:tyrosine-type recombinase/integrase [Anaerolineae bacterium]